MEFGLSDTTAAVRWEVQERGAESSLQIGEMSNVCRWRPVRVQQEPESVANHMLGLGAIYLREKQEREFTTKPVASVLVRA